MPKRNTVQRRHQILQQLSLDGEVHVDALARALTTSEVTIRKDLALLEQGGLLLRRYGGAISMPTELTEHTVAITPRKKAIAQIAAQLIRDHNRILIDFGSTTAALIPELSSKRGLVVMTNSLHVANAVCDLDNEPTLLMSGGTWDAHSESFQGKIAETVIASYDFDQLFIGCDGIDIEHGTTTFNELMQLSRVMAKAAREVIVMAESCKIGRRIPNIELGWEHIDHLITDYELSPDQQQHIEQHGVQIHCTSNI